MSTFPIDSDEYRDRRDAMDDRMSPLDLAVEAATQQERDMYLELHAKYLNLKDAMQEIQEIIFNLKGA